MRAASSPRPAPSSARQVGRFQVFATVKVAAACAGVGPDRRRDSVDRSEGSRVSAPNAAGIRACAGEHAPEKQRIIRNRDRGGRREKPGVRDGDPYPDAYTLLADIRVETTASGARCSRRRRRGRDHVARGHGRVTPDGHPRGAGSMMRRSDRNRRKRWRRPTPDSARLPTEREPLFPTTR